MSMMVAWINVHTAWMLVNLKTSNNIICIFFCRERKATCHDSQRDKKANLVSMTTTCMSFFSYG